MRAWGHRAEARGAAPGEVKANAHARVKVRGEGRAEATAASPGEVKATYDAREKARGQGVVEDRCSR